MVEILPKFLAGLRAGLKQLPRKGRRGKRPAAEKSDFRSSFYARGRSLPNRGVALKARIPLKKSLHSAKQLPNLFGAIAFLFRQALYFCSGKYGAEEGFEGAPLHPTGAG